VSVSGNYNDNNNIIPLMRVSCSSETSSYSSECHDDEEIALAIHAAEMTARHEARSRFKNTADLIHRLFVCISGHCYLFTTAGREL